MLQNGLRKQYADATVNVSTDQDLTQQPWNVASKGKGSSKPILKCFCLLKLICRFMRQAPISRHWRCAVFGARHAKGETLRPARSSQGHPDEQRRRRSSRDWSWGSAVAVSQEKWRGQLFSIILFLRTVVIVPA